MASDLTPDRLDFLRGTANLESGIVLVAKEELLSLLDMAERCADYDRRLGAVMPADFKDWHQNSRREWPEVAASTITNLRQREDWAHAQMAGELLRAARTKIRNEASNNACEDHAAGLHRAADIIEAAERAGGR